MEKVSERKTTHLAGLAEFLDLTSEFASLLLELSIRLLHTCFQNRYLCVLRIEDGVVLAL